MATKTINIGGEEFALTANGQTPVLFRIYFREDVVKYLMNGENNPEVMTSIADKLAFIMSAQNEGVDVTRLSEKVYLDWIAQFDPMDFISAAADIVSLYVDTSRQSSTPRKKVSALIGK